MLDKNITKFNVRVYGIAINSLDEVLLTDEYRLGMRMTKFPGGGLEFGEGTIDCLKRECVEEMGQEIRVMRHFYTTDFFQATELLDKPQQLISIYYLMRFENPEEVKTTKTKFDFKDIEGAQTFRWVNLQNLTKAEMTFPIDKKIVDLLKMTPSIHPSR